MSLIKIVQESVSEMNSAIEQDFMFFNKNNPIEDSEWSLKDENRQYLYKVVEKTKDELEQKQKNNNSFVKFHLISSQISLLEAELERKKEMIQMDRYAEDEPWFECDNKHNKFIQEDITYLTEQVEECKKLLK